MDKVIKDFKTVPGKVVVLVDKPVKKVGNIEIPNEIDKYKDGFYKATIITVGPPTKKQEPLPVKEGDRVLITKLVGREFTHKDVKYRVLPYDDIVAIIDE